MIERDAGVEQRLAPRSARSAGLNALADVPDSMDASRPAAESRPVADFTSEPCVRGAGSVAGVFTTGHPGHFSYRKGKMDHLEQLKRSLRDHLEAEHGAAITPAQIEMIIEAVLAILKAFQPTPAPTPTPGA